MDSSTLLAYQPGYYKTSKVMEQINNANSNELTLLNNKIAQVRDNYYFDTLDSNMCDRWEKILNITSQPSDDISYRRIKISSYFAGMGNFSAPMIKNIAHYYSDADVDPVFDVPNFKILIKIISDFNAGLPYNLKYFEKVIEELQPATFQVDYNLNSKTKDVLNVNTFTLCGEEIRVFPYQLTTIESTGEINIAMGQTSGAETITVGPKEG